MYFYRSVSTELNRHRKSPMAVQHAVRPTQSTAFHSELNSGPKIFLALCDAGPYRSLLNDIVTNGTTSCCLLRENAKMRKLHGVNVRLSTAARHLPANSVLKQSNDALVYGFVCCIFCFSSVFNPIATMAFLLRSDVDDVFVRWTEPLDFDGIFPYNYFLEGFVLNATTFDFKNPMLTQLNRTFDESTNIT